MKAPVVVAPDTVFVGNPVTIRARDGRSYKTSVDIPRGDPALPLSDQEIIAKYTECAQAALTPEAIRQSLELMLHLENVTDVRQTMELFLASASRADTSTT